MSRKNLTTLVLMLVLGFALAGIPPARQNTNAAAYELAASSVETARPAAAPLGIVLASLSRPGSLGNSASGR